MMPSTFGFGSFLVIPPLRTNSSFGKSRFNRYTYSYFSGGTSRFSFGESPFSTALRAWAMKVVQPAVDTVSTNFSTKEKSSIEFKPSRCLTVTGIFTASRMARTQSATSSGSAIRQAPNAPRCTRSLGQPMFRLTSS